MFSIGVVDGVWIGKKHVRNVEVLGTKLGDITYTYQISEQEIRLLCVERAGQPPLYYRHVTADRVHELNHTVPSVLAHIDGKPLSGPGYAFPLIPFTPEAMFAAVRDNAVARDMSLPNPMIDTAPVPFDIGLAMPGFVSKYGIECDADFIRTEALMECVRLVKYGGINVSDVHPTSTYYCNVLAHYSKVKRKLLTGE